MCHIACPEKKCAKQLCAKGLLVWVNMNSHLSHRQNNLSRMSELQIFCTLQCANQSTHHLIFIWHLCWFLVETNRGSLFFISVCDVLFKFYNQNKQQNLIWIAWSFILFYFVKRNQCVDAVDHLDMWLAVLSFYDKCSFWRWTNHMLCWVKCSIMVVLTPLLVTP